LPPKTQPVSMQSVLFTQSARTTGVWPYDGRRTSITRRPVGADGQTKLVNLTEVSP
jgi:hypothetical protein